jgi:pimeloyl-ACP methyl ester carboxylesterase
VPATVGHVTSGDGTRIAFRRTGHGPPLVLVHGTTSDYTSFRFVAPLLAQRFTLYAIDRRGRGKSGDAADYSFGRELDDLACVVESLDGPADVFGHSFGATVALAAAPRLQGLRRLVLYEGSPGIRVVPNADVERIAALLDAGDDEEALAAAYRSFGLTEAELGQIRGSPVWPVRVAAVHTIAREIRAEEEYRVEPERFAGLAAPVLLLLGEESPPWAREAAELIRGAVPQARIAVLPGQAHVATLTAPELVADELLQFLAGNAGNATA